jgi:hypothetical protein
MTSRTSPVSDLAVLHETLCTQCISERYHAYAQVTYSQQIKIVLASFVHYSFRTKN